MLDHLFALLSQLGPLGACAVATAFTFSMTTLGAMFVVFFGNSISSRVRSLTLGSAAGIMIAASVWSLLMPSIELAQKAGDTAWIPAAGGFVIGVLFLALLDKILPHLHPDSNIPEGPRTLWKKTTLLVFAVTLHNIPEGMSVGLAFGLAALSPDSGAMSAAFALALGIGLQNIPEGTAVALPLYECGYSRFRSFVVGSLSGIVEPIFGLLTVLAIPLISMYMPWLLSFAAGAMMYVVCEELIPEAHLSSHSDSGTLAVMAGFVIMMILDVALG